MSLKGNDIVSLQEWTPKLVEALKKIPQPRDVGSDVDEAGPRQMLQIDRDTAAMLMGVSVGAIDSAPYDAFGQRQVSTIYSDINQFKVVVSALPNQATDPASLERIYVRARSDAMVPITAVTKMVDTVAPTEVNHEDQFSTISLSFNLAFEVTMSQAQKLIQDTITGLRLPGDIRLDFAGDFRDFRKQQGDNSILIFGAIIAVHIVLGMLYESLIHPVTILSTLPSAGVGALLAMVVTGTELSAISMIAIVLLIGIVKKNAIVMVDFALVAEREHGLAPFEAIREASLVRFRPIMMTSMVAICAALPLAIGFGVGSELRRPLGIAMIGGLIVSQSLTLLPTPAIYPPVRARQRTPAQALGGTPPACRDADGGDLGPSPARRGSNTRRRPLCREMTLTRRAARRPLSGAGVVTSSQGHAGRRSRRRLRDARLRLPAAVRPHVPSGGRSPRAVAVRHVEAVLEDDQRVAVAHRRLRPSRRRRAWRSFPGSIGKGRHADHPAERAPGG